MKYLVIDTETSGLPNWKLPADAPGQPRLAQLGMLVLDDIDASPVSLGMYIQPDGWVMDPGAEKVNGLSTGFLRERGVPVTEALEQYVELVDAGYVVVAFSARFDLKIMRGELRRAGWDDRFERTPNICVMRACTDILRLPKGKFGGYKFPKLEEACRHFGIVNTKTHDALGDASAAYKIFRALHGIGRLPAPAVHYAKERV